jgi:two-component system, sensor histidine kinase
MFGAYLQASIRRKWMAVVLATTFAALLVSAVVLVLYDLTAYRRTWVNDLVTQSEVVGQVSAAALAFDDPGTAHQNLSVLRVRPQILAAAIYDADGKRFATYLRDPGRAHLFPARPGPDGQRVLGDRVEVTTAIADPGGRLGTIVLSARYDVGTRLASYLAIVGVVMLVSLLIATLISSRLQTALTAPILALTRAARDITKQRDFTLRVQRTTRDEIGELVDTFNTMIGEVGRRAEELESANQALQHEMTVRQEAERALRTADQRKDEFLATLAHELRNPLAPLRTSLEILRLSGHDPATGEAARAVMDRQLRQMVRLVDDLLDVSRITQGKLTLRREWVELGVVLQSALDTARPFVDSRGIQLDVAMPRARVLLDADAARIAQVFSNLLHNAAKFTDPGGRISVTVETQGEGVAVAVTDTGIGIPAEQLPKIFEMFTQLDRSLERPHAGLGVGLSLARRLIEMHGGTLEAQSEGVGRGSRFVVCLPAVIERAPADGARRGTGADRPPLAAGPVT